MDREAEAARAVWWKLRLTPRSGRWVYFVPLDGDTPVCSAKRILGVDKFMRRCRDLEKIGARPDGLRSLGKIGGVEVFQSPST
jgi:hypothetical protein